MEKINDIITDDFIDILCGEKIGHGISREVFECRLNEKWVVKVEKDTTYHQNIREYAIWEEIQYYKKMSKWFAPCIAISPHGTVLIQEKTHPTYQKDLPKEVPVFLSDIKQDNFGMIEDSFVCFDYGTTPITRNWSTRMKKITW